MIYSIPFAFSVMAMTFKWNKNSQMILFFALTILLAFICGFRGEDVGVDTSTFWRTSENIIFDMGFVQRELLYVFLVKFSYNAGLNLQLVYLIYAAITMLAFSFFIWKFSNKKFLSLFIFVTMGSYYLSTFNQFRQYAAIASFSALLYFVKNKKPWHYFIGIILCGLFLHISALLLLPFYFFLRMEYSVIKKLLIIPVVLLASDLLIKLLLLTPYAYFIIRWEQAEKAEFFLLLQLLICIGIMIFEKPLIEKNKINRMFCNLNYFCFLTVIIIFAVPEIPREGTQRITNYFLISNLILLPEIIYLLCKRDKIIALASLFCFLSLYYIRNLNFETYKLTPYTFNFNIFG